jgi:Holliday junction resolvase RusA-like endonuclease
LGQVITFTVVGNPVAQARPRATRFGNGVRLYDPKKIADFKTYFKLCASEHAPEKLIDSAMVVTLDVHVQRPKSWPKKRIHACVKPDADNLAKGCLDSMEGVIYTNDSRIVCLLVEKHLSDKPRVDVRIEVLEE